MTRWVAYVRGDDRIGTLTALTSVFSSRGVGFESFATGDVRDGAGLMTLVFTASARLAHVLTRTLERLAVVRAVTVVPAETAQAVALVTRPRAGGPATATEVVVGTLAQAEAAAATARAQDPTVLTSIVILPAPPEPS